MKLFRKKKFFFFNQSSIGAMVSPENLILQINLQHERKSKIS